VTGDAKSGEGKAAARALDRAAASLRKHAVAVSREVTKLERRHIPRGNDLDVTAHEKRSQQNVLAIAALVSSSGEQTALPAALKTIEDQMRLRQMNGFGSSEFLHLSYVYLTVLRRFVVTDGKTLGEGLAAWDAVEEFLLPKMGEYIRLCLDLDDPTMPSAGRPKSLSELLDVTGATGTRSPFATSTSRRR
jgi:hypothetical protein